jgi:hypothetical protein
VAINNVRPVTTLPVANRPVAAAPAKPTPAAPAPAPKASTSTGGAIAGGVTGAAVMTAAYTAIRWFSNGMGPVIVGVAGVGIGLAALGGAKVAKFVERGFKFQDFTVGGALGGALAMTAYAGGGVLLASFSTMSPLVLALMGTGAALATLGGATIGRAAQDGIVGLFKK